MENPGQYLLKDLLVHLLVECQLYLGEVVRNLEEVKSFNQVQLAMVDSCSVLIRRLFMCSQITAHFLG